MTSPSSRHPEPRPSHRVASLFDAAAAPGVGPVPGEQEALAAFRSGRPRRRLIHPRSFAAALAASATTAVLVTGGVSAAVPGSVSDAARETAGHVLRTLGINVPGVEPSPAPRPRREVGASATTPTETASEQEAPDESDQLLPRRSGTARRAGVEQRGVVSKRVTVDGRQVVEEGDVLASAPTTDAGVRAGDDLAAPSTGTDDTTTDGTTTDGTTTDGTTTDGPVTDTTATDTAAPTSGDDLPSATATDDSDVQTGGDVPTPTTTDSVGVEEDGGVSPSATPGGGQVGGMQGHAPEGHGLAEEGRLRDGGRTTEAGGQGDGGNDGTAVEPGKSAARDDVGLLEAATAGDGWAATVRRHRH